MFVLKLTVIYRLNFIQINPDINGTQIVNGKIESGWETIAF